MSKRQDRKPLPITKIDGMTPSSSIVDLQRKLEMIASPHSYIDPPSSK